MKKVFMIISFIAIGTHFETQAIRSTVATGRTVQTPLGPVYLSASHTEEVDGSIYLGILAASLVIKIAYDWSWHADYANKSNSVFSSFMNHVTSNGITSLRDKYLYTFFDSIDPDLCLTYESWLRTSYDSWLKPWNWTEKQKTAYEKMQILSMISLHGPIIVLDENAVDGYLVQHVCKNCSAVSQYPLIYYANQIDSHLDAIKKGFFVKNYVLEKMILELQRELYKLKRIIRGNKAYIEECHTLRTHQLLEQAANRPAY